MVGAHNVWQFLWLVTGRSCAWNSCSWVLSFLNIHGDSIVAFQRNAVDLWTEEFQMKSQGTTSEAGCQSILSPIIHRDSCFPCSKRPLLREFSVGIVFQQHVVNLAVFLFSNSCFLFYPCYLWFVADVIRMNSNFITDKTIALSPRTAWRKQNSGRTKKRWFFCRSHIELTWSPCPLPQGCWAVFEKRPFSTVDGHIILTRPNWKGVCIHARQNPFWELLVWKSTSCSESEYDGNDVVVHSLAWTLIGPYSYECFQK